MMQKYKMNEEQEKIKYFIYARRSVEKRDSEEKVVSIESQIHEMTELAKKRGLEIVGTFSEAKSAKEPYVREQFNLMMKQISEGKANGIISFALSRLARNSIDEGQIKYFLQKSIIQRIITPEKDHNPEDNVLLASLDFGIATQYSIDLTKHVKRGLRASCNMGYRPSFAPLGYKNSKYHQKGKQEEILVDEERFFVIRKIFDYVLTDKYTVSEVYRMACDEGLLKVRGNKAYSSKMVSMSYFFSMLRNPFYYGIFEYPVGTNNFYKGNHVPMLSQNEYDRIQEIIGNKPRRVQKYKFTYTGILRCGECGSAITAERKVKYQLNGNVHNYLYYHCTKRKYPNCSQKCISEKQLEEQIHAYLKDIHIPREFHDWALSAIDEVQKSDIGITEKTLSLKKKAYTDCENKLQSLLDMRLANEISKEEFAKIKASLEDEKAKLHSDIFLAKEHEQAEHDKMIEALSFAESACFLFEKADMETKRVLFQSIGSKHLLKDGKLLITVNKPLILMSEMRKG